MARHIGEVRVDQVNPVDIAGFELSNGYATNGGTSAKEALRAG
jgi:hypothetical protein